jgi:predicted metal-dependent hydrolase
MSRISSRPRRDNWDDLQRLEPVLANGTSLDVVVVATSNKNSYASVRNGILQIRIPRRLGRNEAQKVANEMYSRMKRAIERRPHLYVSKELTFADGQRINAMGADFCVHISEGPRRSCTGRMDGPDINISLPESLPAAKKDRMVASIARRLVYRQVKPRLVEYVEGINRLHFNSEISDVRMHGGRSRWGFYAPDGVISLSFSLLFMPQKYLEYVTVHELAHTKVRGHGKRFWGIVGSVLPDHRERRRHLNEYCGCAQDCVDVPDCTAQPPA